jgi:hypothetical protein
MATSVTQEASAKASARRSALRLARGVRVAFGCASGL